MTGRARRVGVGLATVLALAAAHPVAAQQAPAMERTIRVSGTGEVSVEPDAAQLMLAVESTGATAQAAGQANARTMQRVVAALTSAGIPRDSIETRNYSLFPEYANEPTGEAPRIRAYRASNQVVVKTGDLDRIGALIDVALGAGANRFEGISFMARDTDAAQAEALQRATQRAHAQAQAIARALGVPLGHVLDASTVGGNRPVPVFLRSGMVKMDAEAARAPTPIEPGQQTVTAEVSVTYAIGS